MRMVAVTSSADRWASFISSSRSLRNRFTAFLARCYRDHYRNRDRDHDRDSDRDKRFMWLVGW